MGQSCALFNDREGRVFLGYHIIARQLLKKRSKKEMVEDCPVHENGENEFLIKCFETWNSRLNLKPSQMLKN